jgi:hypothetical protein
MPIANNPAVQRMCAKLGLSAALLAATVVPVVVPISPVPSISADCHNSAGPDTFNLSCAPPTVASDLFNEQNIVDATIPGQSAAHSGGGSTQSGGHAAGVSASAPGGNEGVRAVSAHAGFSPHAGFVSSAAHAHR